MSLDLFSAFIIGLLGSGHCIAMCGGITTMLTAALPPSNQYQENQIAVNNQTISTKANHKIIFVLLYNIGRITSYAFIGALVGFTGSIAAQNIGMPLAGLRLLSALFMILLGLYLGQWLLWLNRIEAIGKHLWQHLSPLASKAIPVNSPLKAFTLGTIWGWLPCGLVYSTLTWALASGDMLTGAGIMAFFGLGTLPALITLSVGLDSIKRYLVNPRLRKLMALSLILFGVYSAIIAYQLLFPS